MMTLLINIYLQGMKKGKLMFGTQISNHFSFNFANKRLKSLKLSQQETIS